LIIIFKDRLLLGEKKVHILFLIDAARALERRWVFPLESSVVCSARSNAAALMKSKLNVAISRDDLEIYGL